MPADCTVYNATTINWTNQELGAVMEGRKKRTCDKRNVLYLIQHTYQTDMVKPFVLQIFLCEFEEWFHSILTNKSPVTFECPFSTCLSSNKFSSAYWTWTSWHTPYFPVTFMKRDSVFNDTFSKIYTFNPVHTCYYPIKNHYHVARTNIVNKT